MKSFDLVVAVDEDLGIGWKGELPWLLPADMKRFKDLTLTTFDPSKRNAVIMGRLTYASISARFRPLKGRLNAVLSRSEEMGEMIVDGQESVLWAPSFPKLLASIDARDDVERIFLAGGTSVYAAALKHPRCGTLHLTRVKDAFECDAFFPLDPGKDSRFVCTAAHRGLGKTDLKFDFETWELASAL